MYVNGIAILFRGNSDNNILPMLLIKLKSVKHDWTTCLFSSHFISFHQPTSRFREGPRVSSSLKGGVD